MSKCRACGFDSGEPATKPSKAAVKKAIDADNKAQKDASQKAAKAFADAQG